MFSLVQKNELRECNGTQICNGISTMNEKEFMDENVGSDRFLSNAHFF